MRNENQSSPLPKIYAYEITARPGMMHIYKRGGGGGFYPVAKYRLIGPQPSDAEMRTTEAWHSWCVKEDDKRPFEAKQ